MWTSAWPRQLRLTDGRPRGILELPLAGVWYLAGLQNLASLVRIRGRLPTTVFQGRSPEKRPPSTMKILLLALALELRRKLVVLQAWLWLLALEIGCRWP